MEDSDGQQGARQEDVLLGQLLTPLRLGNAGAAIDSNVLDVDISRVALKGHCVVTTLVDLVSNGDVVGAVDVDAVSVLDVMFAAAAISSGRFQLAPPRTIAAKSTGVPCLAVAVDATYSRPTIYNIIATCNPLSCGLVLEVEAVRVLNPVRQVVGEVQRAADFERRVLEMCSHALVDAVHIQGREHNAAAGDGATLVNRGKDVGHVVLAVPEGDHYAGFVVIMIMMLMTLTMISMTVIRCRHLLRPSTSPGPAGRTGRGAWWRKGKLTAARERGEEWMLGGSREGGLVL
ncbi:hypothetical protein V500_04325 [Pseudogymnoascus sp. VKM F-4518 (FW-2643)]|nr:hypothetical protein V500_04325 [Pseudogymnoascus sp. VKM F-4518 (FW-2643)]